MGYLIGTDEAGYGPNFGPMVVSATVWHVESPPRRVDLCRVDLYDRLAPTVTRDGNGDWAGAEGGAPLWIADSKAVYRAGQGLAALERGVHAALGCCRQRPGHWRDLWPALTGQPAPTDATDPCCADFHCELPIAVTPAEIERAVAIVHGALRAAGVRLVAVRSRAVFAREFNELVAEHGGKGAALSHVTTELLSAALDDIDRDGIDHSKPDRGQFGRNGAGARSLDGHEPEPAWIVCDKHGGRNRYAPLLQQRFPETLVEVRDEGRARSVYRWRRGGRAIEAHFCAGGERHLPVALASMVSKYLREVSMLAFNRFWGLRLPDLRPTAGYPGDARRFRREIAGAQRALGIDDRVLWRAR